jgi:dienelactone hydrolase
MTQPENPVRSLDPPGIVAPGPAVVTAATATRRRRPRRRTVVLGIVGVIVVALVGSLAWFFSPQPLLPEATAALASSPGATFSEESTGLTYTPTAGQPSTGLILYPGAKVPAAGYAPTARAVAEQGYLVVVVPMPLNFAIFDVGAADEVIAAHTEIERWAIGGHSLGGAMAAQYAADHATLIAGLALCGAYSAADLSTASLAASSVYGSLDAAVAKIEDPATTALQPAATAYERIEGGNHEQCGWYTGQPNDPPATISREKQQGRLVAAWVAMLAALPAP